VYYDWVYTLLVDLTQRYPLPSVLSLGIYGQRIPLGEVNQQSIYPVIVHWAEDTFGGGQPAEYIPGDSTLGRGYLWARSTSRVYTSPKGILCPVYYHWVYTLLIDFTQRYPLLSVLSLGMYSAG
jgi:hypothetical protein